MQQLGILTSLSTPSKIWRVQNTVSAGKHSNYGRIEVRENQCDQRTIIAAATGSAIVKSRCSRSILAPTHHFPSQWQWLAAKLCRGWQCVRLGIVPAPVFIEAFQSCLSKGDSKSLHPSRLLLRLRQKQSCPASLFAKLLETFCALLHSLICFACRWFSRTDD